jgi:hypothetical protein
LSYNYTGYLNSLANLAGTQTTNAFFVIEVPNAIDYAEQRIFRDLDLLIQVTTDSSQTTVALSRNLAIPTAFVAVNNVNLITPAGSLPDSVGSKRNQLVPVSEDYLDFSWPSAAGAQLPLFYARQGQNKILLGPFPDLGYVAEYVGTQRPAPLSASNPTTFLTTNLPDLFLTASMIHIAGYQKNFGAMADDPRSAVSWEAQYKFELASADAEELRKRYTGSTVPPPQGMAKMPVTPGAAKQ